MASFLKWFQDGYKNGKFTDIVIVASDGGETKVHDTMLEGRCPELKAQAVEVSEGRNRLSETGDVVTKLLDWVYEVEWTPVALTAPTNAGVVAAADLKLVTQIIILAAKYRFSTAREEADGRKELHSLALRRGEATINALAGLSDLLACLRELSETAIPEKILHHLADKIQEAYDARSVQSVAAKRKADGDEGVSAKQAKTLEGGAHAVGVDEDTKAATARTAAPPTTADVATIMAPNPASYEPERMCICFAANNTEHLVQCLGCDKWFHPKCVRRSHYKDTTWHSKPLWAFEKDVLYYSRNPFSCWNCS